MLDGDAMVKFANGRTIAVSPRHLKINESVELDEANRNHPAAKKLMALAKQRDAGSDAKDYEKAAQMIMKGDAGQLGRYISRMDSYPRDAVISAVKSTDKAMYDKMVSRMESVELGEKVNTSEEEAIQIIANSIAMQEPAVKAALKAANLDPVSVVTALKGKKTIKAMQLGNLVMDHAFGGSINKRDLAPIAKAASAAFKSSPKKVKMESMNFFEFRQALNEAQLYHNSFSAAVQHAMKQVQKKGYEIDEDDWQRKVASGPSKPSAGKTNRYTVNLMKNGKPVKQKLQMQVYGMDSGKYELNMYVS